jgi:magnesium-transporting ATPase (P-type)
MGKKLETGANPGSGQDPKSDSKINEKALPTKSSSSFAMQSIFTHNREKKTYLQRFDISLEDLSQLGKNHSSSHDIRHAMIALFQTYVKNSQGAHGSGDVEDPDEMKSARSILEDIIVCLQQDEETCESADAAAEKGASTALSQAQKDEMEDHMEMAAAALTTIVLRSSPEVGITNSEEELQYRMEAFGANHITEKKMTSFLKLCWEAVQDFVLIMLIVMGIVTLSVETTIGLEDGEKCGKCWLESFAILTSVCIVVMVTASIDYAKQFAFKRLSKSLDASNTKSVIRDGEQIVVTDANIVVGDILSVNSHSLASIPADCLLLGPAMELKMDESSLTGESHAMKKKAGDIILSGTNAIQGSGKMVVIAVGVNSVAGKIKAHVYESEEGHGLIFPDKSVDNAWQHE